MWFFTADEHFHHVSILRHCDRPFPNVEEMNEEIIRRFNARVGKGDVTVHCGDFCWRSEEHAKEIIRRLHGSHIFLKGNHDRWLKKNKHIEKIWHRTINGTRIVACHYAMRTWHQSHRGSLHVHGHSHGTLPRYGRSMDVGVDTNDFYPYSFEEIRYELTKEEM
jgi:calcineurin-like phosphoesterase family protein